MIACPKSEKDAAKDGEPGKNRGRGPASSIAACEAPTAPRRAWQSLAEPGRAKAWQRACRARRGPKRSRAAFEKSLSRTLDRRHSRPAEDMAHRMGRDSQESLAPPSTSWCLHLGKDDAAVWKSARSAAKRASMNARGRQMMIPAGCAHTGFAILVRRSRTVRPYGKGLPLPKHAPETRRPM